MLRPVWINLFRVRLWYSRMENVILSEVWVQLDTVVPYSTIASYKLKYGKTVVTD